MTRTGIDYSFDRPAPAEVVAAGHSFVCRYLSVSGSKKILTRPEVSALIAVGLDIVCVWQRYGDWAHDLSGGLERGIEHASLALACLENCGGSSSSPIYFAVDFDPSPKQLSTVGEYFGGVASVLGIEQVGAYGGISTIAYLFDRGLITYGWQTRAWSRGRWDPRAQLRQVEVELSLAGADYDLNTAHAADFGQVCSV